MGKKIYKGTVVIGSSVHWHHTWQRHHDVATGLTERGYQVLFVEPLPKRFPGMGEWGRAIGRMMGRSEKAGICRQVHSPGVSLLSPRLLPDVGRINQGINRSFFVPRIATKIKRLELARPWIMLHYLPLPASLALSDELRPEKVLYDCVWDWEKDPFSRGLGEIEKQLIKRADGILGDSIYHVKRMQKQHSRVLALDGGVHMELFRSFQGMDPTASRTPLCASFGAFGVSQDMELLREVSHRYPLRLIGPVRASLKGFSSRTQILGPVPHERVPELLREADVLLLPYKKSPHTESIIPAKTFECLATGIPAVAIHLPCLAPYQHLFYCCVDRQEFLPAIEQALHEDPSRRKERIQCAEDHSWPKQIQKIDNLIQSLLKNDRKL